jgi:hypothetical protein
VNVDDGRQTIAWPMLFETLAEMYMLVLRVLYRVVELSSSSYVLSLAHGHYVNSISPIFL